MSFIRHKLLPVVIFSSSIFFTTQAFAVFLLDDVMSREEQYKTGVDKLTHTQKFELEVWLNENFDIKPAKEKKTAIKLTVAENTHGGNYIKLSDGTIYQVAPSDISRSSMWLTPAPVLVKTSNDPNYPFMLINQNNGDSLLVKPIPANQKILPPPPTTTTPAPSTPSTTTPPSTNQPTSP